MRRQDKLINQSHGHESTIKIAVWYTIANLFSKGIAFITTPIFTRQLSRSQFGEFSNFLSWISIITVLATLDLTASISMAKYDYEDTMDEYLSSITLISNVVTSMLYFIVEMNQSLFISIFSMEMKYIRFIFLYCLFWPTFSYLQAKHRVFRKYKFFVALSIVSVLITTMISLLLVRLMDDRLLGRVLGYVIPSVFMNFCLWVYIITKGKKFSWKHVKYACVISIPLIPHTLSLILLGNSDRIMITKMCGTEQNAMYTLAYQISMLASLLWTSMNQAWAPWLYDHIHDNDFEKIREKSKLYLGAFSFLVLGILLLTPEIIYIMGGSSYAEAKYVMPPVILGCCFQFIYGMYVNIEVYKKKTFLISIGTVCASLLNIGLNYMLIPIFGYIAAAYTTLIGYMALFLFHYLIVNYRITQLSNIYEKGFIFKDIVFLTLASAITLILIQTVLIRYLLVGVYITIGIFIIYRNQKFFRKIFGFK